MSWGGIGGLHGQAAVDEGTELTELVNELEKLGVVTDGKVEWDPQEGSHSVQLTTARMGIPLYFNAEEFRAFARGVAVMERHVSGEKA
ncbi:hypothetical protein [Streptomyces atratus]|uniref:hypothetical protein n=1 Tax=Streptomyces atratus TaxID=1893 RepID=UPI00365756C3